MAGGLIVLQFQLFCVTQVLILLLWLPPRSLLGEALAIRFGLILARSCNCQAVVCESDSLKAIKALFPSQESCHWSLKNVFADCVLSSSTFQVVDFSWAPRDVNFLAHNLALWARLTNIYGRVEVGIVPSSVLSDVAGWNPALSQISGSDQHA